MASDTQSKLDDLKAQIEQDDPTPELRTGATQLVFGDGNPDADVVFIGEAPGKNEDEQGKPFVGAAGKFLNEMLEMINLKRDDIYITNIVKYRPPNNRDPLPEEKDAFLPYLSKQLDIIKPKLIVTLGRHSMDVLLPGLKISQVHGQPKRVRVNSHRWTGRPGESAMQGNAEQRTEAVHTSTAKGAAQAVTPQRASSDSGTDSSTGSTDVATWVILPLFHPAAALYNGGLRQTLIDDFALIPEILTKI